MTITKDMAIGEVISKHPKAIQVFFEAGLHCIGCCAANFETIEQGCSAHGIDAEELVKKINENIEKAKKD